MLGKCVDLRRAKVKYERVVSVYSCGNWKARIETTGHSERRWQLEVGFFPHFLLFVLVISEMVLKENSM